MQLKSPESSWKFHYKLKDKTVHEYRGAACNKNKAVPFGVQVLDSARATTHTAYNVTEHKVRVVPKYTRLSMVVA